jgi:hypothetical protein
VALLNWSSIMKLFFILLVSLIISCYWNFGYYVEPKVDVEIFFNNDSTVLYEKVTVGEGSNCLYLYKGLNTIIISNKNIKKYRIIKIENKRYPTRYYRE